MSLLLLFHGAAAAVVPKPTGTSNFPDFARGKAGIGIALTAAVLATTLPIMPPRVPEKEFRDGWRSQFSTPPAHLRAQRSVALLGGVTTMPPRRPEKEYQDGWRSKFQEPVPRAPRDLALLGDVTDMPPRRPEKEFQDGWRSHYSTPVLRVGLSGAVQATIGPIWAPIPPAAAAVATPTELWHTRWQDPPKAAARSVDLLGAVQWPPQVPQVEYQDGWRSRFIDSVRLAPRSVDLLGKPIWAARVADVQYQDGWRSAFSTPPVHLQPRRSVDLLGNITDMPARVPDKEYQDGWRSRFTDPPAHLKARRSVDLLTGWPWPGYGYFFQAAVAVTPTTMWFERWPNPMWRARRSLDLLTQSVWPPQVIARVDYGSHDVGQDYWRARRSVSLLGQAIWVPTGTPVVAAVTPTQWWFERWPSPPKLPRRSVQLLGQTVWAARVPDRQFQDGWRVQSQDPSFLFDAQPRLPGVISFTLKEPIAPPVPPTIGVSVTFTFTAEPSASAGAKPADTLGTRTDRGASMTKGAKPGDTLATRTDRGGSLTTGVKKPDA